jgi:hypothetical protein
MRIPGGERAVVDIANVVSEADMENIKPLAVVALLEDQPERGLRRGQVGTVVERLAPGVFEVEFCDNEGRTYASLALRSDQLMILHHELVEVG